MYVNRTRVLSEPFSQIQEIRVEYYNPNTGTVDHCNVICDTDAIRDFGKTVARGRRRIKKHPSHWESLQCDFYAGVEVQFFDGETDYLWLTKFALYRMLETKGGSGDYGFVAAESEDIYNFLENYK